MFLAMSAINLDKIFHPKSIAVIGNDSSNGTIYSTLVQNLMNGGYSGKVYPIHSWHKKKWKQPARPSLLALDSKVDLVVSLVDSKNESTINDTYTLPINHSFESWGDANARKNVYSLRQPVEQ